MRIEWSDIAKAARETSEQLNGKDWVNAGIKARVLLADLADEIERLRAEVARLTKERDALYPMVIYRRQIGCGGPAWWEVRKRHDTTIHATEEDARKAVGLDPEPSPGEQEAGEIERLRAELLGFQRPVRAAAGLDPEPQGRDDAR